MGSFLGMEMFRNVILQFHAVMLDKTEDVHFVLHNYVIRNSVSVPPASHEVAISAHMLAGGRVPQFSTEIHN